MKGIHWATSERAKNVFNIYFILLNHATPLMASKKMACDAN
jgi:hypothetical protein